MYKKILVPMALDHGISPKTLEIARNLGGDTADIIALHIHERPQGTVTAFVNEELVKESHDHARAQLAAKTEGLAGVTAEMIDGHSYRSIVEYATEHNVDCIVIGSHKPGLSDYLLGSTAARVVRHARCAVHVYRSS